MTAKREFLFWFAVSSLMLYSSLKSAHADAIEALNELSPHFTLGQATRPNLRIQASDSKDLSVSLGIRFQGTALMNKNAIDGNEKFDFLGRRVRFEM